MSVVRLTNDRLCCSGIRREPPSFDVSHFLMDPGTDGLWDLALITRYAGIHSSPDPFVILEMCNKHSYSRHACIHRNTHTHSCVCMHIHTHFLPLCSLHQFWHFTVASAQSEASWWKPEKESGFQKNAQNALSYTSFIVLKRLIMTLKYT